MPRKNKPKSHTAAIYAVGLLLLLGLSILIGMNLKTADDISGLTSEELCKNYYDGCNNCSRSLIVDENGKVAIGQAACTERACFTLNDPYCSEEFSEKELNCVGSRSKACKKLAGEL